MAGPAESVVYTADDTTAYCVKVPTWEANVTNHAATLTQAATACTTEPPKPAGVRRRRRYYIITATGKEGSFTVLDSASNLWTSPVGTAITIPLFGAAPPGADNATLRGRTGERTKAV
jgi:hypothetical protein